MTLHVDDDGFVRAPAADCYRVLTHVAVWPEWWPGTSVRAGARTDHFELVLGAGLRRIRLAVAAHGWRHDQGFRLAVTGDLVGEVEYWLDPGWGGTVVHHLATLAGGTPGAHGRYRRWVRQGLWGLKDRVQAAVLEAGAA